MWNILVVEDNSLNSKLISKILENHAQTSLAVNVDEAKAAYLTSIAKNPYDLILLDIGLPADANGIDFLKWLRREEEEKGILLGNGIPIIMTTADRKYVSKSYNEGCDDYILKPIQVDVLLKKMEEKLGPSKS